MIDIKYKQFVIVPIRSNMGRGKIASQVAHATFMALEKQRDIITKSIISQKYNSKIDNIDEWKNNGMCVIVLECKNTEQLMSASKYFDQWKIVNHLYIDEGITEVDPLTPTALATGILDEEQWWMLSQFELFRG